MPPLRGPGPCGRTNATVRSLPGTRLVAGCWLALGSVTLMAQSTEPSTSFYTNKEDGWFWYEDPAAPEVVAGVIGEVKV